MIKDFKTAVVASEDHLSLIVKLRAIYISQANYSKGRITVVLRIDTSKYVSNERKIQN